MKITRKGSVTASSFTVNRMRHKGGSDWSWINEAADFIDAHEDGTEFTYDSVLSEVEDLAKDPKQRKSMEDFAGSVQEYAENLYEFIQKCGENEAFFDGLFVDSSTRVSGKRPVTAAQRRIQFVVTVTDTDEIIDVLSDQDAAIEVAQQYTQKCGDSATVEKEWIGSDGETYDAAVVYQTDSDNITYL